MHTTNNNKILFVGDTETCEEVQLVQDVQEQEVVVTCGMW